MNLNIYFNNIWNKRFPALKHKNFRIYWLGQCVSLMGTWMQNIGMTWLVFSITGSPLLLGLLEAVRFLPITLFSLFAGVIIDKFPKRKILLITQTISMALAFILSALVFTKTVRYEFILILALVLGFTNTIDNPARQSFTVEMTGKEDLMNAIALSSVTFNLARIVGPALGALVLAVWGPAWCFLLNGLSFITVIISLLIITVQPYRREMAKGSNILAEIKDGLKYLVYERHLFQTITLILVAGVFVFNYEVLVPVFTKNILNQGEQVYGFLMSSLGIGSLLGALIVSMKRKSKESSKILFLSLTTVSILLVLIGLTRAYYLTIILLVLSGITNLWFNTIANVMLQLTAKDEYRGRVMSVFSLVNSGTAPLGYILSGVTADRLGADTAFFLCGAVTIVLIALVKLGFSREKR